MNKVSSEEEGSIECKDTKDSLGQIDFQDEEDLFYQKNIGIGQFVLYAESKTLNLIRSL